ncbi:5-methylcytosine-specific restriction protein A [Brevundimonas alba]|uniref:5-methylcytosine-specific restriction protein A n=1 Tax=Brevundimonas alba TaxID=74314 RepID=A0A7X5YJS9_9CAUL|nr:HNH endonuclease signature motif containing protein [Brevundimonas alba]NJC41246.1 5-methylcytosine-specific restriction protein A [Brevundimonas alba]
MAQNLWSDDELAEAIRHFRLAMDLEARGVDFKPVDISKGLAKALPNRAQDKASRRLSNVAVALKDAGRPHTARFGLTQTRVGTNVRRRIVELWDAQEDEATFDREELSARAQALRGTLTSKPPGNQTPPTKTTTVVVHKRDPKVVAWVLQAAAGVCEGCQSAAPFQTASGPFLEVHHLKPLGEGGPDIVENAVAICPNCHRALHHASDRAARRSDIEGRVARIIPL